eukprot:scaffold10174_cov23-Cyclotella_meneghiniana.AAC.1
MSGSFLMGILGGGQQAVELAYLSEAVEPSVKTEYVATLGTVAVIGTVTGPSIGALFSQIDTTINGLPLNTNNIPGFMILVASSAAFVQAVNQVQLACKQTLKSAIVPARSIRKKQALLPVTETSHLT